LPIQVTPASPSAITVEITVDEPSHSGDDDPEICVATLTQAAVLAANFRNYTSGQIGVRVCNDAEIRTINDRHLQHDYATDVISFGYVDEPPYVEGELVVSWETAKRTASNLTGWSTQSELILYVVHGVLHICSMDDTRRDCRLEMRAAEHAVLTQLGITDISRFGADDVETCEDPATDTSREIN
jgi:probable rRNA maturation factor